MSTTTSQLPTTPILKTFNLPTTKLISNMDGTRIYAAGSNGNIYILDSITLAELSILKISTNPIVDLLLHPSQTRIVALVDNNTTSASQVIIINITTMPPTIVSPIDLTVAAFGAIVKPIAMIYTSVNDLLIVDAGPIPRLIRLNFAISPPTQTSITVGNSPNDIVYSPANNSIYVANYASGSISVIDSIKFTLIKTILNIPSIWNLALSGNILYATTLKSKINLIDITTNTLLSNVISLPGSARGLIVDSKAANIYVCLFVNNQVVKVNLLNLKVDKIYNVGVGPSRINIIRNNLLVSNTSNLSAITNF
jgi:YVTN family beta-propeller protein